MKQLAQKLKDGIVQVLDVPAPAAGPGMVLVKNHYSLISAGTEGGTVSAARKGLVGKALDRPAQVRQALDVLKDQGPVQTYRAVMKKLDSYSPLGYSSAGEVIEVGAGVTGFSPGERAACAGAGFASHAEIVAVPVNLCVKLPPGADLARAAYNTLGAIALQGVRQAGLGIGETCAVIGLGLLGQLTCLILRAGGIRTVGFDIDPEAVKTAGEHAADLALAVDQPGAEQKAVEFAGNMGVDAVIITAAASDTGPVNLAGRISRKKGRVVVVGDVPTGFDREPDYYHKELELRMSCSYGPGRYDPEYEEKGKDYPPGYVRWTENRNMAAFQELVHSGKIDLDYLTTHRFDLDDAPRAYDLITAGREPHLGIIISYDAAAARLDRKVPTGRSAPRKSVSVGLVGAGSYATGSLLPHLAANRDVALKGVMTRSGTSARSAADRFGFEFCTSDENDLFSNQDVDTVFIATRHDSHARYVIKALSAGKNVYVEKPLCLKAEELEEITGLVEKGCPPLMVGFNRRFSPLAVALKERMGAGPMAMTYRVNAGAIPPDSWIHDPEVGGGRVPGECCHFIDFLTFMSGSLPVEVHARAMPEKTEDTVIITLRFGNGSIGSVQYFANGSGSLAKERIEIYRAGVTGVIMDFRELEVYGRGRPFRKKLVSQDKGQKTMIEAFIRAIKQGGPSPIAFDQIRAVTLATMGALDSLRGGVTVRIDGT